MMVAPLVLNSTPFTNTLPKAVIVPNDVAGVLLVTPVPPQLASANKVPNKRGPNSEVFMMLVLLGVFRRKPSSPVPFRSN
jgi:hypothetical protein